MQVKNQQHEILLRLLGKAVNTDIGTKHQFGDIQTYTDFCDRLPIRFYEDIEDQIESMKDGAADLLWPGTINRFAVSAGTTGEGKHLPLSPERLESDRRFMRRVAFSYLKKWSRFPSVFGTHLSLPGSVEQQDEILVGEISGFTALGSPWWLRPFQVKNPAELTKLDFSEKFEAVLESALTSNVKVIVAVPSWILTLFQQAIERTGKDKISQVWPNLKLLICGGVKLSNYKSHLNKLYGQPGLDFIETYGASEGYFSYSDEIEREDMKLVYDNNIFYEFIPDPLPEMESLSIQPTVPLWEVEPGQPYAMLVTTNAGLWRYAVNDIVQFTSVNPPRITVLGRLSEMLDDYGEGLYLYEAEEALNSSCHELGLSASTFTIGAMLDSEQETPRHYWFVQFSDPIHTQTLHRLANSIDEILIEKNRHYAIRRESKVLNTPIVQSITQQDINRWLAYHDRKQAQGKLPSILNDNNDIVFFRNTDYHSSNNG